MAFCEVDDAFLNKTITILNTSQVPIPIRCVPATPGGGPGGPNTSNQYNNAGAFGGSIEWTHQRAAAGVGPKATLQATAATDAATEFRCLDSAGNYGCVLSFTDDPNPANRFSTCAGDGLFQVDAYGGDLELKSISDVFVLPQGSYFQVGTGAGALNQSSGFEEWRHTGTGPGSRMQATSVETYQFSGTGPGSSCSWSGVESWTWSGIGPTSTAQWSGVGTWLTDGTGTPGSTHTVQGFEQQFHIGSGPSSQLINAQFASVQNIGLGAGAGYSSSGFQTHDFNGIGPAAIFQIASVGQMNIAGAGPLAAYLASGWDNLDEQGTRSVTSLRRTRDYRAIERILSIPIAGSYTRDRGFQTQEFDGLNAFGSLFRAYQWERVSLEASGSVELNGAASPSPQVVCNLATETSKAPDRVLAWNGSENEYRDTVRVLKEPAAGSGVSPPSVLVNLSAAGVPDGPIKIVATLHLQNAGAVNWMFRAETFAFVSSAPGTWVLVSNQGGVNSANPGGGIGLAANPLGGGVIQFFAIGVDPLMPALTGELVLEIV